MNLCRTFVRQISSEVKKFEALKKVGIVGVPFEKGQKKYGVSVAPAALRTAGLIAELQEIENIDIKDYGDIQTFGLTQESPVKNMDHLTLVSECNKNLSRKVTEVLKDDRLVISLGGDHSIAIGSVDGHYQVHKDMILLWVGAHADINTNKTSESGSLHGMTVALIAREFSDYWPYLPTWDWHKPTLSVKSVGYIGLRSVDRYERLAIDKYQIPCFAMEDIDDHGIQNSVYHVLKTIDPAGNRPIHVSFDVHALDALEAPSTGTPVRGGLTLREGILLMEIIQATGRLRAVDLVEINPAIGDESDRKRTIEAGISLLKAAAGFSRKGSAPSGALDLPIPGDTK